MTKTVNSAFNEFLKEKVNLGEDQSKARDSRNWLMDQIHSFRNSDDSFPKLYSIKDIFFGSFARKTQIRPLDDIDIMVCISGEGSTYDINNLDITVPLDAGKLRKLCNDGEDILNSIKVLNKFKTSLNDVHHYGKAEIKRKGEAVTLQPISYTWNFDIVPCFFTAPESDDRTYYLIPDGNGGWKKTDPRLDRDRVIEINKKNSGKVLNVIRLVKYWNKRPTIPSIPSYLIENMVLDYYKVNKTKIWIDLEFKSILNYIKNNISNPINDPKNIQGDLNDLSYDEQKKIRDRASLDYDKAVIASDFEIKEKDHESAINKWKEIFGSGFPDY